MASYSSGTGRKNRGGAGGRAGGEEPQEDEEATSGETRKTSRGGESENKQQASRPAGTASQEIQPDRTTSQDSQPSRTTNKPARTPSQDNQPNQPASQSATNKKGSMFFLMYWLRLAKVEATDYTMVLPETKIVAIFNFERQVCNLVVGMARATYY